MLFCNCENGRCAAAVPTWWPKWGLSLAAISQLQLIVEGRNLWRDLLVIAIKALTSHAAPTRFCVLFRRYTHINFLHHTQNVMNTYGPQLGSNRPIPHVKHCCYLWNIHVLLLFWAVKNNSLTPHHIQSRRYCFYFLRPLKKNEEEKITKCETLSLSWKTHKFTTKQQIYK